jgi:hypothetical protein
MFPRKATGSFFKCDEPTRFDEAETAAKAAVQHERAVYTAVNLRDKYHCRACGAPTDPTATGLLKRGHHHHIVYRSAGGETTTANTCLVCAKCHADEHAHRIAIEGNADVGLTISVTPRTDGSTGYIRRQETAPHVLVPRD